MKQKIISYITTFVKLALFAPAVLLMASLSLLMRLYTLLCYALLGKDVAFEDELSELIDRFAH